MRSVRPGACATTSIGPLSVTLLRGPARARDGEGVTRGVLGEDVRRSGESDELRGGRPAGAEVVDGVVGESLQVPVGDADRPQVEMAVPSAAANATCPPVGEYASCWRRSKRSVRKNRSPAAPSIIMSRGPRHTRSM
jgi:hypothetical protein